MRGKVLHVLSQRPSRTGSGITLDAIVSLARAAGWRQEVLIGVPEEGNCPSTSHHQVGGLDPVDIFPVTFGTEGAPESNADLPFPIPGMSDVMPYPSSIWSTLDDGQVAEYRRVWREQLRRAVTRFQPDIIHTNHIWLVSSLLRETVPNLPLVATCHATGLRQMTLCPHLAAEVIAGCRNLDHIFALRQDHRVHLAEILTVPRDRISVIGVGFRDEVFYPLTDVAATPGTVLYVGKFSNAKGLPWLLDAWVKLRTDRPGAVLHVAGDGAGPEAERLRQRMQEMGPAVVMHGQLDQEPLAHLMRRCQVCVLPSFYEGVPLVLAEAAACGCRIVATDLPGVREQLAPHLGEILHSVTVPTMNSIDAPAAQDLPAFVANLEVSLAQALDQADRGVEKGSAPADLGSLTWSSVFQRVEKVWLNICPGHSRGI